MKKLNLFYLILALNYIYEDPLFATPNRNITWTSNSCWIDSGLQCMTTFHHFNQALQQQALHESSLGYKLRSMLNELKKNSSSPVNVSDFYQSAVGHGIGAHGTGGGDFVPSILFYLLNNNLPEFKKFFRIIEQNKRGEKIVKNDAVKNAEAQKAEIQKGYKIPDNLKFPKTQEEKETKALLIQQRNNILAPFDKIIQENTKKVPLFEYRVSYYTTISNTDEITIKPHNQLTRIIAPLHLLLKLSSEFNQSNIPLKISPYFSRYSYDLQAKGLTTPGHATCMVHDGIENWYFYDDLGKSIKLVNEAKIEDLKYEGKQSDFLYYNRTEKYSVDLEDPLVLSHFARDGNNDQVESILKTSNHDVNQKNEDLFSPLHWAILSEQPEIVEILIDSGANVNAKTISDETPLHFAALVGSTSIIDSLIKQGASIEAINSSNNTPLHYAVKEFNVGATELLLDYGANVNAISDCMFHPLNQAIHNTSIQTKKVSLQLIQLLLSFGANKNLSDNGGKNSYERCNTIGNELLKNEVKTLLDTIVQTRHPSQQKPLQDQSELSSRLTNLKLALQKLKIKLLTLHNQLKLLSQSLKS